MSNDQALGRKTNSIMWVLLCVLILTGYVLSHAPMVRLLQLSGPGATFHLWVLGEHPAYVPVDFLVGHTPLRYPLMKWAKLWDVKHGEEVRISMKPGVQSEIWFVEGR